MNLKELHNSKTIRTITGLHVNVFEPTVEMICIEDIAHALSHMPRFGGHTPHFYSVAQHSVACAMLTPPKQRFQALLHDATEAYLMDIPKPIKRGLPMYNQVEAGLMKVICEKFGLPYPLDPVVKKVDKKVLEIEYKNIIHAVDSKSRCLVPEAAKERFLEYYELLKPNTVEYA